MLATLALLVACSGDKSPDDTQPAADDSAPPVDTEPPDDTDDSAPPSDSEPTDTEPPDTEPPDTDPPDPGNATLSEGGVITCPEPELRTSAGPLELAYGGVDWANQYVPDRIGDLPQGRGVIIADFDSDGNLDIYLPNMGRDQLFMGQDDGTWDNETSTRWHTGEELTTAGAAVDVDDDGDIDLMTLNRGTPNQLYLNDGKGFFTLAGDAGFSEVYSGSATGPWGDMDGDGDLDLFIGAHFSVGDSGFNDFGKPAEPEPSELYENLGGGVFLDRSDLLSERVQNSFIYAATWIDLDDDDDLDLYLVNDFGLYYEPNIVLTNTLNETGEFGLEDTSAYTGLDIAISGMGMGVGDLNGDLRPDFLMSSWDDIPMMESLSDGTWYNTSLVRDIDHDASDDQHTAWGIELLDMDNDGDLDAPVLFGYLSVPSLQGFESPRYQPDELFIMQDDGTFQKSGAAWGFDDEGISRGFANADLNHDGFLDLVKVNIDGPRQMYLSRCDQSAWLIVNLEQPAPNRQAVGAQVLVEVDGVTQIRWVHAGGWNLNCAGPVNAHFGLGDISLIDKITVIWPDGEVSEFADVVPRQEVTITRHK